MSERFIHKSVSPLAFRGESRSSGNLRRGGFTLVELVVSVGILSILLGMAGTIFTLTLKSSGEATALIEVNEAVYAFEQQLKKDLGCIQPDKSMLVIQGNTINAYWNRDAMESDADGDPAAYVSARRDPIRETTKVGSDGKTVLVPQLPSAHVLMLFTARPGRSYKNPEIKGQLQQVVYGHAEIGELDKTGLWAIAPQSFDDYVLPPSDLKTKGSGSNAVYELKPDNTAVSIMPTAADRWHMARRSVLILDQELGSSSYFPALHLFDDDTKSTFNKVTDDENTNGLKTTDYVVDGRRDYLVSKINPNMSGDPATWEFSYQDDVIDFVADPSRDIDLTIDGSVANWMKRSKLDTEPPVLQQKRLGHYFIPNCASFKVEWALDVSDVPECSHCSRNTPGNGEIIWIDPAHFAENIVDLQEAFEADLDDCGSDATCLNDVESRRDAILKKLITLPQQISVVDDFDSLDNDSPNQDRTKRESIKPTRFAFPQSKAVTTIASTHAFYATEPFPWHKDDTFGRDVVRKEWPQVPDPLFPKALRITVDVFDPAGRLERPIRHVMVIPVGEG